MRRHLIAALYVVAVFAALGVALAGPGGGGSGPSGGCPTATATTPGCVTVSTPGGASVTATTAALALFVATTGSDSANCTSVTTPCLTIQAAVNKIPFLVANPVTVDIAAGDYAGYNLSSKTFNAADAGSGAYISIRGAAQTNTTPATGTATGTLSAVSTDSVTGLHIVTDGAQTWTANDTNIETRFLTLVTGTGAGQTCPISNNTATVISVACTFSPAPVAGTTYAIVSPSTRITTGVNSPATATAVAGAAGGMIFSQIGMARGTGITVNVSDIEVAGAIAGARVQNALGIQFQRNRLAMTSTSSGLVMFDGSGVNLTSSVVAVATGSALAVGNNQGEFAKAVVASSYIFGTNTPVAAASSVGMSISFSVIESSTSSAVSVVNFTNFLSQTRMAAVYVLCTSSTAAIGVRVSSGAQNGVGSNIVGLNTSKIEGCAVGLQADRFGAWATVASSVTFLSNTTAVKAFGGGRVGFVTAVPTFTTNTNDIDVDGVVSTRAAFVALTPNSVVDLSYLSSVVLQP